MRHRCEICGKKPSFGHNVSHSNRKTSRRWLPNIQKTSIVINGVTRSVQACTRCIRTARKHLTV
ncbi:MAG: 50S ribosomal protein L28 [Chloroflexi bacterium]|jgi:large subunit ribosomal protein L28|nr:50S ribosomal protein L28 [Chloroflexota bacterium]